MTLITNSFRTSDAVGNREDLSDTIDIISPTDTPFFSMCKKGSADAVLHEWQKDSLAAASSTNFQLEGDAETASASTATTRLSNTCFIARKVYSVTNTQEVVKKAGRRSEMAHQRYKATLELKRDIESILLSNNAEVTADSPREAGTIGAWIDTNTSNGSGGSDGSLGNTARTDGTQREFTETLLKTVLAACWEAGGDPDCISVGSFNKQQMSGFTGNATRQVDAKDEKLYAAIQVYRSDFGDLEVIPNRFQRSRDALILQKNKWEWDSLRPFHMETLAVTGDARVEVVRVEGTLASLNEAASGAVWDLTTSA